MTNKQIERQVRAFQEARQEWIDILVRCPSHRDAPAYIMSCNAKIELLMTFVNWSEPFSI